MPKIVLQNPIDPLGLTIYLQVMTHQHENIFPNYLEHLLPEIAGKVSIPITNDTQWNTPILHNIPEVGPATSLALHGALHDTKITYFENLSTMTIILLYPSTSRNPMMKSILTLAHSLTSMGKGYNNPLGGFVTALSF